MDNINVKMEQHGLEMNVDKVQFAMALKTWRLRAGLTQAEVGKMWGCSRYTILRAESGRNMTWEMAYRLFARLSEELRKEGEK